MNILLLWIILPCILSVQVPITTRVKKFRSRSAVTLGGMEQTCYALNVTVNAINFLVLLDTGSSDTMIPNVGLNSYSGPCLNISIPNPFRPVQDQYGDGSYWYGFKTNVNIGISPNIMAYAPIFAATSQSTNPIFISGISGQGLMGLAYNPLSLDQDIVMDEWYNQGQIPSNSFAFHACSDYYIERGYDTWIDFGNQVPYAGCRNETAVIPLSAKDYFRVSLQSYSVNGKSITTRIHDAIFDSCTTIICLDTSVLTALKNSISTCSTCFSNSFRNSQYFSSWLNAEIMMDLSSSDINLANFPTLAVNIKGLGNNIVTLTLGGAQYVDISGGYYSFLVTSNGGGFTILGTPFYASYHIVHDRTNGLLTVMNGCGCTDGIMLPRIANNIPVTTTIAPFTSPTPSPSAVSATVPTPASASVTSSETIAVAHSSKTSSKSPTNGAGSSSQQLGGVTTATTIMWIVVATLVATIAMGSGFAMLLKVSRMNATTASPATTKTKVVTANVNNKSQLSSPKDGFDRVQSDEE